jgi:hypothetical protein
MNGRDGVLLFNGAVGTIRYRGACQVTAIRIRRDSLSAAMPGVEDLAIRRAAPATEPLNLLAGYTTLLTPARASAVRGERFAVCRRSGAGMRG